MNNTCETLTFINWMTLVDRYLDRACGLGHLDIPDYDYAADFEDGETAGDAARAALAAAGSF